MQALPAARLQATLHCPGAELTLHGVPEGRVKPSLAASSGAVAARLDCIAGRASEDRSGAMQVTHRVPWRAAGRWG